MVHSFPTRRSSDLFAPEGSCRIGPSLEGMDTMHEWRNPFELRLPGSLIAAAGEMCKIKTRLSPGRAMDLPPTPTGSMTNGHDYGTVRMNLTYCLIDFWRHVVGAFSFSAILKIGPIPTPAASRLTEAGPG